MKHLVYLIIALLIYTTIKAQPYSIDQSFAPTYSFWDFGVLQYIPTVNSIIERDDGKIYIGGKFADFNNYMSFCNIVMLYSDGSINTNFQTLCDVDFPSGRIFYFNDTVYSIWNYGTARYNGNTGDFDWDYDQIIGTEIGGNRSDIEIFDDGTMLIAIDGFYHTGLPEFYHFWLGKLKPTGHLDTTFHHSPNYYVHEITKYDNERLLLHGSFTQYDTLNVLRSCRIYNDGTLDTSYHNIFSWGWVKPAYIQPDGKIIVMGWFTLIGSNNYMYLARLNSDGSLDSTFNNFNNFASSDNVLLNVSTGSVCPTPEGKLIIGNNFDYYQAYPRGSIVLTDSNGFIDTTAFNGSGFSLDLDTAHLPYVLVIIPGQNDTYYISGRFSEFNGEPVKPIIRILGHTWGIEEPDVSLQTVKVYPNPATDIINISVDKSIKEKVGISIYNINGTLIKSLPANYPNKTISISTKEFTSGIYFCEVIGSDFISREKFVVVR